jgi:Lipocalin-like domain
MRTGLRSMRAALAVALMVLVYQACGGTTDPTPTSLVGSWVATSLTAPSQPQWGDAVTNDGLSVHLAFTSGGSYTYSVSGDNPSDSWMCDGSASCTYSGTYTTSGSTITFNQGTASEYSATYAFSPGTMTITEVANVQIQDPYRIVLRPS